MLLLLLYISCTYWPYKIFVVSPLLKTLFRTSHSCGLYSFIEEYPPCQVSSVSFRPHNLDPSCE